MRTHCRPREARSLHGALRVVAAVALAATVGGCGEHEGVRLGDYLGELEFEAPLESVAVVPLGKFRVPLTVRLADGAPTDPPIWMRLRFELFAETNPGNEDAIEEAVERYHGPFHDSVIRICRHTTPDELSDPRLSAMKSRLTEMARPLLGEHRIRNLVITNYASEPL